MPRAPKRFGGIEFFVDASGLIDFLATGEAVSEAMYDTHYINDVVDLAFGQANETFNVEAASMGAAGSIKHMFEWGTQGVNRGRTNMRPNPLSEKARLWKTEWRGRGLKRNLNFVYKPSVAKVPKPTTRDTNMSQSVINKLRDHVFRNKAMVIETGASVTIAPKKAKFLLIPAYPKNRNYFRPNDIKRGYRLYMYPMRVQPGGAGKSGNFTQFFGGFWQGRGNEMIDESIDAQIKLDFPFISPTVHSTVAVRKAGTLNVTAEVREKARRQLQAAKRKAKARNREQ